MPPASVPMPSSSSLPIIDLHVGECRPDNHAIARNLDRALSASGFCYITGHGVQGQTIENLLRANREFHAQTDAQKQSVQINRYHRGYISNQSSTLVTSSIEKPRSPNHSESFMVMQPVDPSHSRWGNAVFGPNQWPRDLGEPFRVVVESYYQALEKLSRQIMRHLARALGEESTVFDRHFTDPTVFLRLLRYPSVSQTGLQDAYGTAPHTDHGFITLVAQDARQGLEVRQPNGIWLAVEPQPHTFVLNVADILSLWSGGRWPSTPHRVTLSTTERYSAAFFFDPNYDTWVESLVHGDDTPSESKAVHYGDYLMSRFDRNYAYRRELATQSDSTSDR